MPHVVVKLWPGSQRSKRFDSPRKSLLRSAGSLRALPGVSGLRAGRLVNYLFGTLPCTFAAMPPVTG